MFGTLRDEISLLVHLEKAMLALNQLSNDLTLEGSFSAVSTLLIARVGAFFQDFRDLQDLHSFAPLRNHRFTKISSTFCKILLKFHKISIRISVFRTDFHEISSEFHEIFTEFQQISETSGHNF